MVIKGHWGPPENLRRPVNTRGQHRPQEASEDWRSRVKTDRNPRRPEKANEDKKKLVTKRTSGNRKKNQ